jgi:hypothetical protein
MALLTSTDESFMGKLRSHSVLDISRFSWKVLQEVKEDIINYSKEQKQNGFKILSEYIYWGEPTKALLGLKKIKNF